VGGGSYLPVDGVAEIAGVGILPAYRRRGLAAQVTFVLASDARAHGVDTVFCSADSDDVARVYGRIGFIRVGTACIVER
jgi:predicted GNAT family acetyltransferase